MERFEQIEGILWLVTRGKECPYPIEYEGIYSDFEIAVHVADRCGGKLETLNLDYNLEHLKLGKWVYNTCVKLSEPEIVFCRPVASAFMDGGEDIVGHTQHSPDRDRLYMYVWAVDEDEAKQIILGERAKYGGV
jgi:hypothetical protein